MYVQYVLRHTSLIDQIITAVQISAVRTVPGGPSIACSTPRAIEWDESFKGRADCSGRAVAGVHADAYDATFGKK